MPETNNNFNSFNSAEGSKNNNKKSKLPSRGQLFIVLGLVILIIAGTFLFIYFNPEAVEKREMEKGIEVYKGWIEQLSEDDYGGKTPQETLDMFIGALRDGDLELASKFFSPEIDENNPEKMTWQGHLEYLKGIEEKGFIERMANDLGDYDKEERLSEGRHVFNYHNDDGSLSIQVVAYFNEDSGVWKIENFYE